MKDFLHFDPITLIILVIGFVGTWATLRRDSAWHTEWIKKHSEECDVREKQTTHILGELEKSNSHLTTLIGTHHERLVQVDNEMIRLRDRQHELANAMTKRP